MRRTSVLITVTVAALLLVGCSTPHTEVVEADHEEPAQEPAGRQGWRITGENAITADWSPSEVCGGDYVFVNGFGLQLDDHELTDLEGNSTYSGPYILVQRNVGDAWGYHWYASKHYNQYTAGEPVEGWKLFPWGPDANGHPFDQTISGGTITFHAADGGVKVHRGEDSVTFRFERITEPDWCVEDEEYNAGDPKWAWKYYD